MVRYKDVSLYFYEWNVSFLLKTENEIFLEWIEPEITHIQSLLVLSGYLFDADDCIFCYESEASEMEQRESSVEFLLLWPMYQKYNLEGLPSQNRCQS
ncbi:hypothetical protein IC575_013266 [Cucumis melo]